MHVNHFGQEKVWHEGTWAQGHVGAQGTWARKAQGHVGTQGTMARRARRARDLADSFWSILRFFISFGCIKFQNN